MQTDELPHVKTDLDYTQVYKTILLQLSITLDFCPHFRYRPYSKNELSHL